MRALRHVGVAACLLFFVLAAGSSIRTPGLYYDEVLFVNAALGNSSGPFIVRSVLGVPVMLMRYIGALKSYIYYPIFRLFGVSPGTIRWPVIIISAGTLLLAYALARQFLPAGYSVAVLALAASDPSFIGLTKLDYGPVVIGAFLRVAAVLAFLRFMRTGGRLAAVALVMAIGLGLFDKLLFIWFVNALIVAALIVFRHELAATARSCPRRVLTTATILLVGVGAAAVMLIAPLMIAPLLGRTYEPFLPHMRTILAMTKRVMDGYALAWTMTDREVLVRSWTWIAVLVAIGLASLPLARGRAVRQPVAFFLVLFAATLLQLFLTWQARAVHHTISLWPWHLLLIGLVARDLQAWGDTRTRWMRGALVGVFLVLVAGQVRSTMSLVAAHRFERGFHPNWDPAIYQLSAALEREYGPTRLIMSTDWGLHTPLHALAALTSRDRYRDAWLPLMTIHRWSPLRRREWALQLAARDTLVLTFTDRRARFTTARRNLFELADEQGLTNVRLRSIAGADGRALYEIHRFERPAVDAVRPRSASVGEGSGG